MEVEEFIFVVFIMLTVISVGVWAVHGVSLLKDHLEERKYRRPY